jgi:hypothetical protein
MKSIKYILGVLVATLFVVSCEKDNLMIENEEAEFLTLDSRKSNPFMNSTWLQEDQMGRPGVNTVFVSSDSKDAFNVTIPSEQNAQFQSMFQSNLMSLSPAFAEPDDRNALGLTAEEFTGVLATDVLNVSFVNPTTFFDGTNLLTGRALADDVITVELILIFGGETGLTNPEFPQLTDDNVDANDAAFLTSFPYLASPW